MTPYELFDRCNESELYQIARASGLRVLPKATKPELIKYILCEEVPEPVSPDIDEWRLAIMRFVVEHRRQLEVQLRCPAKSMDPRACFQCVDQQVISCLVENAGNVELIRIHKKPIEHEGDLMSATAATAALNPTNAPRELEQLMAQGSYQMRKLAESLGMLPNSDAMMAYGKRTPKERAEDILKRLKEYDATGGGPASNGTPTAAASNGAAPTADLPGASVPAVNPEAFKSAQDATAPGPGIASTKRQPKTEMNGRPAIEGDTGAILAAVQAVMAQTKEQSASLEKGLTAIQSGIQSNAETIKQLQTLSVETAKTVTKVTDLVLLVMNVLLTVAEERGVAGRSDILADAALQMDLLRAMLEEIKDAGKAA